MLNFKTAVNYLTFWSRDIYRGNRVKESFAKTRIDYWGEKFTQDKENSKLYESAYIYLCELHIGYTLRAHYSHSTPLFSLYF